MGGQAEPARDLAFEIATGGSSIIPAPAPRPPPSPQGSAISDRVIHGGTLVTASNIFRADIGITDGRIAALGEGPAGHGRIDATDRLVLPGGTEGHCHSAQDSSAGLMSAGARVRSGRSQRPLILSHIF